MIKVRALKNGSYGGKDIAKGEEFEISRPSHFKRRWMTHLPKQSRIAVESILNHVKSLRNGLR